MPTDLKLATYGADEPLAGLLAQGRAHLALAGEHATELDLVGWSAADTASLAASIATLSTEKAQQSEAKAASKAGTVTAKEALAKLKALKRKLDLALRRLYRKQSPALASIPRSSWEAGQALRSASDLSAYFVRIRPHLVAAAAAINPLVGRIDAAAEAEKLRAVLDSAEASQATGLTGLPAETLDVYEAKGRLLLLINDLTDAGRTAFADDPTQAARYSKKVLEDARKKRAKAEPKPS